MERRNELHGGGGYPMSREEIIERLSYQYGREQLRKMSDEKLRLFFNINFRDVKVSEVYND